MLLTVVVDGGGTGSRLAAFDEQGALCAQTESGPASLSISIEQSWQNIERGIQQLLNKLAGNIARQADGDAAWTPDKLIMGLSGALQQERREAFLELLPPDIDTILVTDGHAQLLGACGGDPGVCLAAGTGSVVHWLDGDYKPGMAGGWGFPAGDEGSGAWLGMLALNHYLHHLDKQKRCANLRPVPLGDTGAQFDPSEPTLDPLFSVLAEFVGTSVSEIQHWSTCKNPTKLATLVPAIVSAAEQGSPAAEALLKQGADACEILLSYAPQALPVYIVGGLQSIYASRFSAATQARLGQPRGSVFDGLYSLAANTQVIPEQCGPDVD